jgi:hypothetical protein
LALTHLGKGADQQACLCIPSTCRGLSLRPCANWYSSTVRIVACKRTCGEANKPPWTRSFLLIQILLANPTNKTTSSVSHFCIMPITTCLKLGPMKEHFWIFILPKLHTSIAAGHCQRVWNAVSSIKPQIGHNGSSVMFLLHKFPFVGKISWLARQRNFFWLFGTLKAYSFFQKSVDSLFMEQVAKPLLFISICI